MYKCLRLGGATGDRTIKTVASALKRLEKKVYSLQHGIYKSRLHSLKNRVLFKLKTYFPNFELNFITLYNEDLKKERK